MWYLEVLNFLEATPLMINQRNVEWFAAIGSMSAFNTSDADQWFIVDPIVVIQRCHQEHIVKWTHDPTNVGQISCVALIKSSSLTSGQQILTV